MGVIAVNARVSSGVGSRVVVPVPCVAEQEGGKPWVMRSVNEAVEEIRRREQLVQDAGRLSVAEKLWIGKALCEAHDHLVVHRGQDWNVVWAMLVGRTGLNRQSVWERMMVARELAAADGTLDAEKWSRWTMRGGLETCVDPVSWRTMVRAAAWLKEMRLRPGLTRPESVGRTTIVGVRNGASGERLSAWSVVGSEYENSATPEALVRAKKFMDAAERRVRSFFESGGVGRI